MKTILISLALLLTSASFVTAQEGGAIYAYAGVKNKPMMTQREGVLEVASVSTVTRASNITLKLEALPTAGAMLVSYTLPASEGPARLELNDVATGRVVYAGQVSDAVGAVLLPVQDVTGDYEARLITNDNAVGTRLRP